MVKPLSAEYLFFVSNFFFLLLHGKRLDMGSQFPDQGLNLGHSSESPES